MEKKKRGNKKQLGAVLVLEAKLQCFPANLKQFQRIAHTKQGYSVTVKKHDKKKKKSKKKPH